MLGRAENWNVDTLLGTLRPPGAEELRAIAAVTLSGATTIDGSSRELGNHLDQELFNRVRQWSDVVLVGAATVRSENYFGVRTSPELDQRRIEHGQQKVPPIAVLTERFNLSPTAQFFTDTSVAPLILAPERSHRDPVLAQRRRALEAAGGVLLSTGDGTLAECVRVLHSMGLARIAAEGGPQIFAKLFAADLVDVLHLTVDPTVTMPVRTPLLSDADGEVDFHRDLSLEHAVATDDGTLFLRYRRER